MAAFTALIPFLAPLLQNRQEPPKQDNTIMYVLGIGVIIILFISLNNKK